MIPLVGAAASFIGGKKVEKKSAVAGIDLLGMLAEESTAKVEKPEPEVTVSLSQRALGFLNAHEGTVMKGAKEITSQLLGIAAYRKTMKAMGAEKSGSVEKSMQVESSGNSAETEKKEKV